jgi:hypothetical protein
MGERSPLLVRVTTYLRQLAKKIGKPPFAIADL